MTLHNTGQRSVYSRRQQQPTLLETDNSTRPGLDAAARMVPVVRGHLRTTEESEPRTCEERRQEVACFGFQKFF